MNSNNTRQDEIKNNHGEMKCIEKDHQTIKDRNTPVGGCIWGLGSRDYGIVSYWVRREWASLTEKKRGTGSLSWFKRG